jgi:hypothetical protein
VWLGMRLGQLSFPRVGVDALPVDICTVSDVGSMVTISVENA